MDPYTVVRSSYALLCELNFIYNHTFHHAVKPFFPYCQIHILYDVRFETACWKYHGLVLAAQHLTNIWN